MAAALCAPLGKSHHRAEGLRGFPRFRGRLERRRHPPGRRLSIIYDEERRAFHGDALRATILRRGWTLAEFASDAGISKAKLYAVIAERHIRDVTFIAIAKTISLRNPISEMA